MKPSSELRKQAIALLNELIDNKSIWATLDVAEYVLKMAYALELCVCGGEYNFDNDKIVLYLD